MSSVHEQWRSFLRFLDKNPELETALELVVNVLSSLGPLAIAALVVLTKSGEPTSGDFGAAFSSFFEKGELSLLILAMSGSIAWLVTIKTVVVNLFFRTIFVIYTIFILTYVGVGIISGNKGFEHQQHDWVLGLLWWIYISSLIVWAIVSVVSKRAKPADGHGGPTSTITTEADVEALDKTIASARARRRGSNAN